MTEPTMQEALEAMDDVLNQIVGKILNYEDAIYLGDTPGRIPADDVLEMLQALRVVTLGDKTVTLRLDESGGWYIV